MKYAQDGAGTVHLFFNSNFIMNSSFSFFNRCVTKCLSTSRFYPQVLSVNANTRYALILSEY